MNSTDISSFDSVDGLKGVLARVITHTLLDDTSFITETCNCLTLKTARRRSTLQCFKKHFNLKDTSVDSGHTIGLQWRKHKLIVQIRLVSYYFKYCDQSFENQKGITVYVISNSFSFLYHVLNIFGCPRGTSLESIASLSRNPNKIFSETVEAVVLQAGDCWPLLQGQLSLGDM